MVLIMVLGQIEVVVFGYLPDNDSRLSFVLAASKNFLQKIIQCQMPIAH